MTHVAWPELPYHAWKDTYETLHMWTQIVGKIRLARMPWLNHTWQVTLYPSASGLTTGRMPYGHESFESRLPFDEDDVHRSYDPEYATRWWRIVCSSTEVLTRFRSAYYGKASPVHFFWGSFDLAVTRFSADDPGQTLLAFLQSTYAAAADLGAWDRRSLEVPSGILRAAE